VDKIRLNKDEINLITKVESLTGARIRDCLIEDGVACFIVKKGDMGLAIGKGDINVGRVSKTVGMDVRFIEYDEDGRAFIQNLFAPTKPKTVSLSGSNEKKAIITVNKYDKGKIIGQNGRKINLAKKLASRHHNIKDIKIKNG